MSGRTPAAATTNESESPFAAPMASTVCTPPSLAAPVPQAERRLQGLLAANLAVTANVTLHEVLSQIVESARDLLDSSFAALGVLGDDRQLAQFLHVGMDERASADLGPLPQGHGILGLLIDDPRPLRLHDLGTHPAAVGFPDRHPPMGSFIGVPIRIRDLVFGNIYLTDKRGGGPFTAEDEDLLVALAANAAVAVDHARLHDESVRSASRQQAGARITTALLSQADSPDVLRMVMAEGRLLVDADDVLITRRTPDREETLQPITVITDDGPWAWPTAPLPGTVTDRVARSGPVASDDLATDDRFRGTAARHPDVGPMIAVPLAGGDATPAVLVVTRRRGRPTFDAHDREAIALFSEHVALALERARARDDRERVRLVAERDRIARDMHDHVIGRLVGSGMAVQGLSRFITDGAGHRRLAAHVDDLDAAVRDLRTLIYGLDEDPAVVWSLPARVRQVVDEATPHLGFVPDVEIAIAVALPAGSAVPEHLLGVLREALANVARHAGARHVHVTVTCDADRVELTSPTTGPDLRRSAAHRRRPVATDWRTWPNGPPRSVAISRWAPMCPAVPPCTGPLRPGAAVGDGPRAMVPPPGSSGRGW